MPIAYSIENIDFSMNDFFTEAVLICRETRGGFSYDNIRELSYSDFDYLAKMAFKLQPKDDNNG